MKVIKKINNNVAICLDGNNKELIAFGKGIGFPKTPYELTDLNLIQRTFYNVSPRYIELIHEIPSEMFDLAATIIDFADSEIADRVGSNIVFTLSDHIHAVVIRYKKGIIIPMPFAYDVRHLYQKEMNLGEKALKYLNRVLKLKLPPGEAVGIALHFINAENMEVSVNEKEQHTEQIVQNITGLIEENCGFQINRNGFNYSRFVTHLQYLLKRQEEQTMLMNDNRELYEIMKTQYPDIYRVVFEIKNYIKDELKWELDNEELLYLMIHVNRLCSREDCE